MNQHFLASRRRQALTTDPEPPRAAARRPRRGFVVLNPEAGNGASGAIKEALRATLGSSAFELYETTGQESLPDVVRGAVQEHNFAWVAAAGGDGTVSQVGNGLVGMETPLAIIPGGTSNLLAHELGIPNDPAAACALLNGEARLRYIDAMRIGEHYYFHQVGTGLEALAAEETPSAAKDRFGPLAYVATAVKEAFGWQPHEFRAVIDGKVRRFQASELLISNTGQIGVGGLRWSAAIRPDDGELNLVVARARSLFDYAALLWAVLRRRRPDNSHIRIFSVRREVRVMSAAPLPVHADGERMDGGFPLQATVVPGALAVLVPRRRSG